MVLKLNIKMKNKLTLFSFLFICSSCTLILGEDDELTLQRKLFDSNNLRIDGYYYYEYLASSQAENFYRHNIYMLFENGLILNMGAPRKDEIQDFENKLTNMDFISLKKSYKHNWGVFLIDGEKIKFERWYPSDGPLEAFIREGQILNDTTFHIKKSYRMATGSKESESSKDELYRFKKFSPKPDSTNAFIK